MTTSKIDLYEVMQTAPFERPLIVAARQRNVDAMVQRFQAGACVVTLGNVLHYNPEIMPSLLEAIDRLEPEQREFNASVLWEMALRLRRDHLQLLRPWRVAHAARRVLDELNCAAVAGALSLTRA